MTDVRGGLRLDLSLERRAGGLQPQERAWLHELTYGVSRLRGRVDHLLGRKVRGGLPRLDPEVLDVLRLGAYQALYMGSVPGYAAVSQSVEQARAGAGRGASSLVNAVLRAVLGDGEDASHFPDPRGDPVGFLSTWGSHPEWLVRRWLSRWSFGEVRALVEADNARPDLFLLPLGITPADAVARLGRAGVGADEVGDGSRCVRLAPGTNPSRALSVLPAVVQDPAANLVVRYADAGSGTNVADLCAAPGGKALALSETAGYTVAADRSELRMHLLLDNARRTRRPIGAVVADARQPAVRAADVVLLDVPCSGTGTLRRHPDGRWRLTPAAVRELSVLQRDILAAGADVVAPGGLLVYATCTLEPEENREVVRGFLASRDDFSLEGGAAVSGRFLDEEGYLELLPQAHGWDGAFAARLRRAA